MLRGGRTFWKALPAAPLDGTCAFPWAGRRPKQNLEEASTFLRHQHHRWGYQLTLPPGTAKSTLGPWLLLPSSRYTCGKPCPTSPAQSHSPCCGLGTGVFSQATSPPLWLMSGPELRTVSLRPPVIPGRLVSRLSPSSQIFPSLSSSRVFYLEQRRDTTRGKEDSRHLW